MTAAVVLNGLTKAFGELLAVDDSTRSLCPAT
jgi:hypothetical protein